MGIMCHHITLLITPNKKTKTQGRSKKSCQSMAANHHTTKTSLLPRWKFHIQSLPCFLGGSWAQNNLWQMQRNTLELVLAPASSAEIINGCDKQQTLSLCLVPE